MKILKYLFLFIATSLAFNTEAQKTKLRDVERAAGADRMIVTMSNGRQYYEHKDSLIENKVKHSIPVFSTDFEKTTIYRSPIDSIWYLYDEVVDTVQRLKYDFDVSSNTDILNLKAKDSSFVRNTKTNTKYLVRPDSIAGLTVDSVLIIPLKSGNYAVSNELIANNAIYANSYELVGDGSTDNAAAFSKITTKLYEYGNTVGEKLNIVLPIGVFATSETFVLQSRFSTHGFRLTGQGRDNGGAGGTTIKYTGATTEAAIRIEDATKSVLSNFNVLMGEADHGILIDSFAFLIHFEDLDVSANVAGGISGIETHIENNYQISEISFTRCRIAGSQASIGDVSRLRRGIALGNANNKNFFIYNCDILQCDTAIYMGASQGAQIQSTRFFENDLDVYAGNTALIMSGCEGEGSGKFLYTGSGTYINGTTLNSNVWSGTTESDNLVLEGGGTLILTNNHFNQDTCQVKWNVANNTGYVDGSTSNSIVATGNYFAMTDNASFPWLLNGSNADATGKEYNKSVMSFGNTGGDDNSNNIKLTNTFGQWESQTDGAPTIITGQLQIKGDANVRIETTGSNPLEVIKTSGSGRLANFYYTGANYKGELRLFGSTTGVPSIGVLGANGHARAEFTVSAGVGGYGRFGQEFTNGIHLLSNSNLQFIVDADNDETGTFFEWATDSDNGRAGTDGTSLMTLTDVGDLTLTGSVDIQDFIQLTPTGTVPTAVTGKVYFDDGTNTVSTNPSLRFYNGTIWIDW